jgi:hypothetical protein
VFDLDIKGFFRKPWDIRLINRKIEELADADLPWADLLMSDGTRICAASRSAPAATTCCRVLTCMPLRISR